MKCQLCKREMEPRRCPKCERTRFTTNESIECYCCLQERMAKEIKIARRQEAESIIKELRKEVSKYRMKNPGCGWMSALLIEIEERHLGEKNGNM